MMRWGVERRLEFIEFRLLWEGCINRQDIMERFGVSVPQASKDLSLYRELAPENLVYDRSEKRYRASASFQPRITTTDADRYLGQLRSVADGILDVGSTWLSNPPPFEASPMPLRHVETDVLRQVMPAIRNARALEVHYQSLSPQRPQAMWRWISPHALAFDGNRWHVRAFCHLDRIFKDFMLSRMMAARGEGPALARSDNDVLWNSLVTIRIVPAAGLSKEQANVICQDFGMIDGELALPVRTALAFYLLRRLNLEDFGQTPKTLRERPIALANPDEIRAALSNQTAILDNDLS